MGALTVVGGGYGLCNLFSALVLPSMGPVVTMIGLASLWNLAGAIDASLQETLSSLFANRTVKVEAFIEIGDELFHREAYEKALAVYNKAYEHSTDPFEQTEVLRRLGLVYGRIGDQEEALKYLDRALERSLGLFPKESTFFAETSHNRAITLLNLEETKAAYFAFVDTYEAYMGLARRALEKGEYQEALDHLDGAKEALKTPTEIPIGEDIEFGLIEAQRGMCLMQLQNTEAAAITFYAAIERYSRALNTEEHPFIAHLTGMMSLSVLLNEGNDAAAHQGFLKTKALLEKVDPEGRLKKRWGVDFQPFRAFLERIARGGLEYLQAYRAAYQVPEEVTIINWKSNPY